MKITLLMALAIFLFGCGAIPNSSVQQGNVKDTVGGSADVSLKKCTEPLGVAALIEPESAKSDYSSLLAQYKLPSPIPLLKLMMARSNCFLVVDRGAASKALQQERELAAQGELADETNTAKGQMVTADFLITPDIIFQDSNAGGAGLLALFVPVAGLISVNRLEAQVQLTATNVRTGVQEAVAEGSAKKNDIGFIGGGGGSGVAGAGGAYESTDIGKIVSAAFMDAHNKLVTTLQGRASR
ncbi:MAG: peptidoglycan-binding protein [Cellvibrionales bacterium]|nr:peptidoglycan-binding protein [Cellvibrionales bacterium]